MTLDQFKEAAEAHARPQGGAKALDPISLLIITSAIAAAVSWLVEHCLDSLLHKHVTNPGPIQRLRLRVAYVGPAVRDAIAARPDAAYVDAWQVEGLATQGILTAAKGLSEAEFEGLKASARAALSR